MPFRKKAVSIAAVAAGVFCAAASCIPAAAATYDGVPACQLFPSSNPSDKPPAIEVMVGPPQVDAVASVPKGTRATLVFGGIEMLCSSVIDREGSTGITAVIPTIRNGAYSLLLNGRRAATTIVAR